MVANLYILSNEIAIIITGVCLNTENSRLADIPLLWTPTKYYGQNPALSPAKAIEVLTENYSHYCGLLLLLTPNRNYFPRVSAITRVDCTCKQIIFHWFKIQLSLLKADTLGVRRKCGSLGEVFTYDRIIRYVHVGLVHHMA